jgi:hypothetical protein
MWLEKDRAVRNQLEVVPEYFLDIFVAVRPQVLPLDADLVVTDIVLLRAIAAGR